MANWMVARVTKDKTVAARDLVVLGEAAVAAEPGEGALDHPAPLDHLEADRMAVAPDYFQAERVVGRGGFIGLLGVVAAVGKYALQPREAPAHLVQQQGRAVAVLHGGRVHHQADRQAQGVHQGVDLAPFHCEPAWKFDPVSGVIGV